MVSGISVELGSFWLISLEHRTILAIERAQEPALSQLPGVFGALKLLAMQDPRVLAAELLMGGLLGPRTPQRRFLQSHYFDAFLFSFWKTNYYSPAS